MDSRDDRPQYETVDPYDRAYGEAQGFTHTREATVTVGDITYTANYTIQTFRIPDLGDRIFLVRSDKNGATRIMLPPRVADTIARQREQLTAQVRRQYGKAQAPRLRQLAAERKAAGIAPAFLKNRGKRSKRRGRKVGQ